MGEHDQIEGRVSKVETRLDVHEKRLDKVDETMQRISERMDQQRDGQVRTQTLVEVGNKDVSDLKIHVNKILEKVNESNSDGASRWEKFYSKAFYGVIGAIVTFVIFLLTSHHG